MGTGIVGILFHIIPFEYAALDYMAVIFFVLNAILFATVFSMSILRYALYPEIWGVMIQDPVNSLFSLLVPWGSPPWALWIVDAVAAASVTVSLSFVLISQSHVTSLERITALQLLPIAATIVASGASAEVADILPDPYPAKGTMIASYVLWGMATPMAMMVLVIYYQRLAVHKPPSRETIVSCFLPLGPLGFGGFSILYLGKVARKLLGESNTLDPLVGHIAYIFGILISLLMWAFGLIWLVFALATIYYSSPFPFNMGWWGFTFPLGVYAANTMLLGVEMDLMFLRSVGRYVLAAAVVMLWLVVASRTARGAWQGSLFHAPCLQNLKSKAEDEAITD
ncbi:TDT family transporter [Aspergillus tanneri]|uniref:C4-dicarboxylate transporter/malic acid transport protein n=1 Tax=Aspergillus tanneri TaxID=1220188 RepID=A0A5M9N0I3_9EURO|nr:uncharacterized protein ATNIH1004_003813 [Aspergillus tanneri]KAA8651120.1 hypothetical protein ATNIH1004_003813 [Aspergillus tanneri]